MLRVTAVLLVLAASSGCTAVAWGPSPSTDSWRGRSLWSAADATVGASGEDAAADVLGAYRSVLGAYAAIGEAPPPPPLLIAVDAGDEVLLGDTERTIRALPRWHALVLRGEVPPRDLLGGPMLPAASPELRAAMVGALTAAVPLADAELALPVSWQRTGQWGAVVPTSARIAATSDLTVDEGMANAKLNFAERLLSAPFLPWARGMVRDKLHEVTLRFLIDASCAPAVLGRPLADAKKTALLAALGLPPELQEPELPASIDSASK